MIVLLRARSRTTATSAPMVPPPTTTARVALGAPSHCPCFMFSSPLYSFGLKSYVSHDAMAHSCLMCGQPVNKNQDFNSSKRLSLRHKVVRLIPSSFAAKLGRANV